MRRLGSSVEKRFRPSFRICHRAGSGCCLPLPFDYGEKWVSEWGRGAGVNYGSPEAYYATMTLPEVCALDIKSLAQDNAVLFLWSPSPMLVKALEVMAAWDFEYKTNFVWHKMAHNFGNYSSVRHEHLLVGTKGSCLPDSKKLIPSVVSIKRTDHSTGRVSADHRRIVPAR
jgi:MT-A70